MKLVSVQPTPNGDPKKYVAVFNDEGRQRSVKFGVKGSNSYVDGASREVRDAYRKRHARDIGRPIDTPGMLSYYITWGDSQDINRNIAEYKRRFNI